MVIFLFPCLSIIILAMRMYVRITMRQVGLGEFDHFNPGNQQLIQWFQDDYLVLAALVSPCLHTATGLAKFSSNTPLTVLGSSLLC